MESLSRKDISVKRSALHGWGVFADSVILAGDIVEECHLLLMDTSNAAIDNYLFCSSKTKLNGLYALPFGYGAIYNHSNFPNTQYVFDEEKALLVFRANRTIHPGEEILISYGANWFGSRDMALTQSSRWFKVKYFFKTYRGTVRSILVTLALLMLIKLIEDLSFVSAFT